MTDNWKTIEENYDKARKCLICPKDPKSGWRLDEINGKRFLLDAYCEAVKQKEKEHLLYARILVLTNRFCDCFSYDRLKTFIEPAIKEYELAKKAGEGYPNEELEQLKDSYKNTKFLHERYSTMSDDFNGKFQEQCALIEGYNKINTKKLWWHDANIESFKIEGENAEMIIAQKGVFKLTFTNVVEFSADYDTHQYWINDMTCYKQPWNKWLVFDIGQYKILCEKINIKEI